MLSSIGQQVAVVLVSASSAGDRVRGEMVSRGLTVGAVTGNLASLRRSLVIGAAANPVVLCITLDDATMRRHGRSLARLLDDRASFLTPLHAIGMTTSGQPAGDWASIGCDVWVHDLMEVEELLERFAAMNATRQADGQRRQDPMFGSLTHWRAEAREMDLR